MRASPAGRAAPRVAEPDPTGAAAWRRYEPWGILGARTNAARDFAPVLPEERGKGVASINQNGFSNGLPDFRNLGVIARVLIGVHLLAFGAVLAAAFV